MNLKLYSVDLYHCSICEQDLSQYLIGPFNSRMSCKNKCIEYNVDILEDIISAYVFEEKVFEFGVFEKNGVMFNNSETSFLEFKQEVEYWRTDYRYLAKILEVSG